MSSKKAEQLQARYERLKAKLTQLGPIAVGSITRRMDRRRSASAPGGWVERGPYYQWTWKEKGKTRTRNLNAEQARVIGRAIKNHRQLEKIILQMRDVSHKLHEAMEAKD